LRTLNCSGHELISLDVSDCPNLEELDCQNNQLNSLNVNNCLSLKKIDCSSNNIKELELDACAKLKEINCNFNKSLKEIDVSKCPELAKAGSSFVHNVENGKLVRIGPQITKAKENDIRNILIIGITGNGKSALSNTLSGTNQFVEGNYSASITKNFQKGDIFE
jgi:Leucine-rich repeat (LRR) protein